MKNYLVFTMATLLLGTACSSKKEHAEGFTGRTGRGETDNARSRTFSCSTGTKSLLSTSFQGCLCGTLPQVSM